MLKVLEDQVLVRIRTGRTLETTNYDAFVPWPVRFALREPSPAQMVIELSQNRLSWDFGGTRRNLKFDAKHKDSPGRIVIIGDNEWREWGTKHSGPSFRAAKKFFAPSEREEAKCYTCDGRSAA